MGTEVKQEWAVIRSTVSAAVCADTWSPGNDSERRTLFKSDEEFS